MRVELALFDGDALLERGELVVSATPQVTCFGLFQVSHRLDPEAAYVVLESFAAQLKLKKCTLTMPLHESEDWESIELDRYTLAFWCRIDA